uniref:superoxide dismutase n=1 Tax=Oryza punctata TaxID=4537 RepID=A0A0E0KAK9_ORYPU
MAGKAGGLKGVALIGGGGGNSTVAGALHFFQDPSTGYTEVRGRVTGLAPGLHGFHIHSFGDTTNGCNSTGPHFNPHNKSHGAPSDDERHVGDLGNIVANKDGVADIFIKDLQISLSGPHSILGRAVVVHADSDDLGRVKQLEMQEQELDAVSLDFDLQFNNLYSIVMKLEVVVVCCSEIWKSLALFVPDFLKNGS